MIRTGTFHRQKHCEVLQRVTAEEDEQTPELSRALQLSHKITVLPEPRNLSFLSSLVPFFYL